MTLNTRSTELSANLIARIRREVERLVPGNEVDDLTQEACARIIAKEGLWQEDRGSFGTWAQTVVRNVVRNGWRRQAKERAARAVMEQKSLSAEPDVFSEDRIRFVLEQFAGLPDDEQCVLRWRYLEERSVDEIALRLACSQPTASRRIQCALTSLRRRAHSAWYAPTIPILQFLGVHKMKLALATLAVTVAASSGAWFESDPDAVVVSTTAGLPNTTFVAGMNSELKPNENTIWCASGPLAWKALERFAGGPIELSRASKTVDQLNDAAFDSDQVASDSYVADAGVIGDGVVERLQAQLKRKFQRGRDPFLDRISASAGKGSLLTYAFLFKQIKWRVQFEAIPNPLKFTHQANGEAKVSKVRAFGIHDFGTHQYYSQLARQVRFFGDRKHFAVELSNPKGLDRVILARIQPGKTLKTTVQRALRLLKRKPQYLGKDDTLQIPVLDFDISHTFADVGGQLENDGFQDLSLDCALQTVRLRLDEKGALLKSRFAAFSGAAMVEKPQRLLFDRPFLLLMQEKGFAPYLAVWVASPELLVASKD